MGIRGPKPKPTALRLLEGNPSGRPINEREPKPKVLAKIDPPPYLSEAGKRVWADLSQVLIRVGLLTEADINPFARYIDYLLEYTEAMESIRNKPKVIPHRDQKGNVKYVTYNPYLAIRNKAHTFMCQLEAKLGLSPADRARMIGLASGNGGEGNEDPYGA